MLGIHYVRSPRSSLQNCSRADFESVIRDDALDAAARAAKGVSPMSELSWGAYDSLKAENERLQARVAELEAAARAVVRAAPPSGPLWFQSEQINRLSEAVINPQGASFIAHKQAEAVNEFAESMCILPPETSMVVEDLHDLILQEVQRLRNEAARAEGDV